MLTEICAFKRLLLMMNRWFIVMIMKQNNSLINGIFHLSHGGKSTLNSEQTQVTVKIFSFMKLLCNTSTGQTIIKEYYVEIFKMKSAAFLVKG